jgi:hypothetical protein
LILEEDSSSMLEKTTVPFPYWVAARLLLKERNSRDLLLIEYATSLAIIPFPSKLLGALF